MAYYGNQPIAGETNSFKVLDDISSYTKTFDGSSAAVVSTSDDTLTFYDHRFIQGQRVTYGKGSGGTVVTGLTDATVYYVIRQDKDTIQLATSASNAATLTAVDLTGVGGGTVHELTVAFDGTNTKFKATTGGGTHIKLTRPGQLMISMNGVVQEPQNNTPTNGFGIESNNVIVFSTAPTVLDTFWGHYLTSNLSSWELSDNKIDNFTGNGSTTTYTLSKTPANADNILVTIDGVTQYPSDSTTTRSYTLDESVVTFTSAPTLNAAIAVRHIGYAGASGGGSGGGGVTGFYGRTGNVKLIRSDLQNTDINLKNLTGVAATFTGNVSIGGTLTYTDVTNIDSIGIVTAQNGINVLANGINVQAGVATFAGDIDANADIELAGNLAVTGVSTFTAAANFDNAITVDGSVGIADSIIHLGNTDTSIRFPANDTVTVETGGTERLRITSGGKIGMGTVSTSPGGTCNPDGNQLLIRGASTFQTTKGHIMLTGDGATVGEGPQIVFSESGSGGNFAGAYIGHVRTGGNSQGDLVFGTRNIAGDTSTVPGERLRIDKDGKLFLHGTDATGSNNTSTLLDNGYTFNLHGTSSEDGISVVRYSASYGAYGLNIGKSRNNTFGTNTLVQDGNELGHVSFYGADGTNFEMAAQITGLVDGDPATGSDGTDMPGALSFRTSSEGSDSPTERLRIDSDGAINIGHNPAQSTGTNTQNAILTLKGYPGGNESSAAILALIRGYNTTSATTDHTIGRIVFGDKQAGEYAFIEGEVEANGGSVGDTPGRLVFSTAPDGTSAPTERLRIDSSGNLTAVNTTSGGTTGVTLKVGASAASGTNSGTIIINNGGLGNASLQFDYEGSAARAKIYTYRSTNDIIFDTSDAEKFRILDSGQLRGQGTYNGSSSTSNDFPCLNINNLQGSYTGDNIIGGVTFGKSAGHSSGIRAGILAHYASTGSDSSNVGTDLVFRTAGESAGDSNEKVRITSAGDLKFSNRQHLTVNNSYTNGSMTIGANVGTSAYTSIKGSSYVRAENYVSTGSAAWLERWKVYQHGTVHQPTRHGDSIETKGGGIYYVINGATPLDGDHDDNTYTPLMRCGHSFNGVMYLWMAFNGTEFHNGCRQQIIDCQGTYGYTSVSTRKAHNQNALGAGLNSLEFAYQNSGTPNYYFKVRGTWASGQNQPYILWTWVGHNSEYPYAL